MPGNIQYRRSPVAPMVPCRAQNPHPGEATGRPQDLQAHILPSVASTSNLVILGIFRAPVP